MLSPALAAVVGLAVLATSFLSGIFGMAGGLILLGVLLAFMDVAPAMVLFGVTQTAANGWRVALWWRHLHWPIIWRYLPGALAAFMVMRWIALLPDKALVYLLLGIIPFAADLVPKRLAPNIERPGAPFLCGAFVMVLQLMAGAAGNVLDIFFQKSSLDRKAIVATKAFTQTAAHILRVAYFGSFAAAFAAPLPWWAYVGAVVLAIAGTTLAARVLHAMSDADFRSWSRRIILAISATYLARGLWLLAAG
jgi:uncharacterized membrane protein YfcA